MKTVRHIALALMALVPSLLWGQEAIFTDEGYRVPTPHHEFEFPRDHGSHPEFKIEWWYLTANLKDASGADYGMHWTLFRQSMSPNANLGGWQSNQIWMAHAALTTPDDFNYEQRFARGGIGQTGVELDGSGAFEAWMDDWHWQGDSASPMPGDLEFTVKGRGVELRLDADTPWVLQGDSGYSQKSELGQASYYYSQPHIRVSGTIEIDGNVIDVSGMGWLDREWSSQPLAPDQPGWGWLSVHLDDGHALMVYQLRQDGRANWMSGSWVTPEGVSTTLSQEDIVFEPIGTETVQTATGPKQLPLRWRVALPGIGREWEIEALHPDHWLNTAFPYWEGPVRLTGDGGGEGYLELTGY